MLTLHCTALTSFTFLIFPVLILFIFLHFTVDTYKFLRSEVNLVAGYPLMPAYEQLLEGKSDLRPKGIFVEEDGSNAQVPMQNTLEHTVNRLLLIPKVQKSLDEFEQKYMGRDIEYLCYFKAGCDGMSGLIEFHQELQEDVIRLDGKLMGSHMIVLQIVGLIDNSIIDIVFQNAFLNSAQAL